MHVWDLLVKSLGWLLLGANLFFIAHIHMSSRGGASDAQRGRWPMLVYLVGLPLLTSVALAASLGSWDWEQVIEVVSYPGVQAGVLGLLAMIWRLGPRASRYMRDETYPAPLIGVWLGVVSVVVAFLLAVTVAAVVHQGPPLIDAQLGDVAITWAMTFVWWGLMLCIWLLPQVIVFGVIFGLHLRRTLPNS